MTAPQTPFRDDLVPQLPAQGLRGRDGPYLADHSLIDAANVALTLGLPLLLTGEPGCGKTEFAYVVANALAAGQPQATLPENAQPEARDILDPARPLECYIRSDTRARDLLYQYDALLRFTDGHHGGAEGRARAEDARHYIELQGLGIALASPTRRVVLIDEIDKAPRDVPNDLLRELDRGEFEIAEILAAQERRGPVYDRTGTPLQRTMKPPGGSARPIVIITSNVERQLPDAFLRRCAFFHIEFPGKRRLRQILLERSQERQHRPDYRERDPAILEKLVDIFCLARDIPNLVKRPSTAELLNWANAVHLFEAARVRAAIVGFAAMLQPDGRVRNPELRWTHLPAIGCLFKLREDLDTAAKHWAKP